MNICIFGAASEDIDKEYMKATEALATDLAKRGHSLVFGAGNFGLMGAAARGFKKGGSTVTGVIPNFFDEFGVEIVFKDCDEIIHTETMRERKAKMEELADAFIIVPGGIGTFEEFFEVLTLKQLGRHIKPIAIFNINSYYDSMQALLENAIKQSFLSESCRGIYKITDDVSQLIDYIENDDSSHYTVEELKIKTK